MSKFQTLPQLGVAAAAVMSLVAAMAFIAEPVQARERTATIKGSQGHSATRNVQRAGGDVSSSTTGAKGKTMSRTVDRSAQGTQATVTGPNGNTSTREVTRQP